MIDVSWGGAQWVLATMFVLCLALPFANKPVDYNFWVDWGGRLITVVALTAILGWGGFWS